MTTIFMREMSLQPYAPYFQAHYCLEQPYGSSKTLWFSFSHKMVLCSIGTHNVAPQAGTKTYAWRVHHTRRRSLRGYSRSHYPDEYIQHMNIQRKTVAFSGDALTTVLKYVPNGKKGDAIGIMWLQPAHVRSLTLEDDFQKMYGRST